ncbi:MAG: ATP-grasp domain-containing protein [Ramlibacter sp.]|nr:ATP-grasp domain-containing protein [Ramlibacter sp.]
MRRLLVANRGEIARRILRTAHRMGMETVAVFSEADAQALHVREATLAQPLGGTASADSYLRSDKLIAAACAAGADAVHPGYGFLSENADFAQAVRDAGLVWVGPPPAAIRALGNKSGAKQLAQERGVPCLPGYHGGDQSETRFALEAACIGFPLMVKAAAGGGGRGMRLVMAPAQLEAALQSARFEAQAAFGSGELLLERALLRPRHVEVQVVADSHGHCIHLGERDCSVQRRHQKIVEETPSPAVDEALRRRMGECAVQLVQAAGYVGAGTVEFLLEDQQFFLMEVNTRLQVEHPVTEMVTGLDLVEWQLRIAQGEPLPLSQEQVQFTGHAIEVRLCAEDDEFLPHAGTVGHFLPPPPADGRGLGLRFDHAIFDGLAVSPHYDSMLGKLVAHGPTRADAIDVLVAALHGLQLLGLPTNRAFLAACIDHEQFRKGQALVPFLIEQGAAIRATLRQREAEAAVGAGLAAVFPQAHHCGGHGGLACPFPRPLRLRHRGELLAARVRETAQGALEVDTGDSARTLRPANAACVRLDDGRWHVQTGAVDLFIEDASFQPASSDVGAGAAGDLRAPFNGKVIAVKVAAGSVVARGDTLLLLESMKLEHALAATRAGVVKSVHVEAGQQAATAQVLVSFEAAP